MDLSELGQLGVDVLQVEEGDLLVQNLGEDIDANLLLAGVAELDILLAERGVVRLEQSNLCKDLVGERAGHDERGVASGAAKVNQTALGKEDDVTAVGHQETINLGLDALHRLSVGLEPSNVDLNVKVADV